MSKTLLLSLILSGYTLAAFAQSKTEDFNIHLPEERISGSLYNSIRFVDSRYDTSNMGIVQLGAFNRKALVIPKVHMSEQLQNVLNALNGDDAKSGELLLHLRHLNFAEVTGAMSERGYCHIKADLYSKQEGRYHPLSSIDTVVVIKSMDVTRPLFRNGSKIINQLISSSVTKTSELPTSFSFEDIQKMDDIDKQKIAAYTAGSYANGIYHSYESFSKQTPDLQGTINVKKGKISSVSAIDETGREYKIKSKDVYAIVHDGIPYVATDYGYYPLQKVNNDFVFTGKAKVTANTGDVIAASIFFGIIGGLIASDAAAIFEMKLDHSTGGFIRLREVKAVN